ncbi:hypothetical protein C5472_06415 [Photorhabdus sp. RW14-46]|uniref:Photorhabdus luminescens subsp. laumondii TTO1 complete genome segment 10/17 n=1 Tax=Photorhabdus laumondii subsp. laumondii (strain DSM 15139 / CIP 105565 / TT01) TaxID=243265 RepID=Q7N3A1_PHOLL|nr:MULTISPECIES: hypothetical protein [Photorhabdus]AWK42535.1 hypothetical protein A4R40_14050 [Photorhabdus laumondii subsp. laumondii]NHB60794.1 hypothetical protein [Photorhabdus sp. RW14-46]RAW75217.1 hypothetical protein CKY15_01860 [Photorhabdus sp. S7-51]RAW80722.1 hypothetical protein CKY06_00320 [Photorhabdus sp. S15-56]RAW85792.1 hypothetical protein CKY09_09270 [Photorhabdus sp. S5P8-50]RAW85969.1 hypothetical protein CKY12_08635 [Photorhabdus sp. S12-55]
MWGIFRFPSEPRIEPKDSLKFFENSIPSSKNYDNKEVRFSKGEKGNIHRFEETNGKYHWNRSTSDVKNPLNKNDIPNVLFSFQENKTLFEKELIN